MARVTIKYNPDDTAYLVESNRIVRKVLRLDYYTVNYSNNLRNI